MYPSFLFLISYFQYQKLVQVNVHLYIWNFVPQIFLEPTLGVGRRF